MLAKRWNSHLGWYQRLRVGRFVSNAPDYITGPKLDCSSFILGEEPIGRLIDKLFELQLDLYDAGARNFLLIDLPPINRSPAGTLPL